MICYTVLQLYIVAINSSSGAWRGKAEQRLRTGPSTVCAWRVACMVPGPFSSPILLCSVLHPRPLARQPFPARLCDARPLSQPPRLHLILAPFFLFFLFELLSFSFFVRFFIFIFIVFVCLEPLSSIILAPRTHLRPWSLPSCARLSSPGPSVSPRFTIIPPE